MGNVIIMDSYFTAALNQWVSRFEALPNSPKNQKQRQHLQNRVVEQLLPYVKRIASGLARRQTDPLDDLVQVGTIGLLKALDRFATDKGACFKTYATVCITGEIRHYLRDKIQLVKAPMVLRQLYVRLNQVVDQLSTELGRTPTDTELARALECSERQVTEARSVERRQDIVSLEWLYDDNKQFAEELIDQHTSLFMDVQEQCLTLEPVLSRLPKTERDMLLHVYVDGYTQQHVGDMMGISQIQVSRKCKKAISKIRRMLALEMTA